MSECHRVYLRLALPCRSMRPEPGDVPLPILTRTASEAVAPAAQAKGLRLHHSISAADAQVTAVSSVPEALRRLQDQRL